MQGGANQITGANRRPVSQFESHRFRQCALIVGSGRVYRGEVASAWACGALSTARGCRFGVWRERLDFLVAELLIAGGDALLDGRFQLDGSLGRHHGQRSRTMRARTRAGRRRQTGCIHRVFCPPAPAFAHSKTEMGCSKALALRKPGCVSRESSVGELPGDNAWVGPGQAGGAGSQALDPQPV
jgi:hypothetical protein